MYSSHFLGCKITKFLYSSFTKIFISIDIISVYLYFIIHTVDMTFVFNRVIRSKIIKQIHIAVFKFQQQQSLKFSKSETV